MSIRTHLWLVIILVVLAAMTTASLLVWHSVEVMYLETQRANLVAQARLNAAALQAQALPLNESGLYNQISNTAPGIHTRILAGQDAVVINLPMPENELYPSAPGGSLPISSQELSQRSEIISALNGEPSSAVRSVPPGTNARVLYAAAPISDAQGSVTGIVYMAMPLPAAGLPAELTWQMGLTLLATLLLALLLAALFARSLARPVEDIARAALQVSEGQLDVPPLSVSRILEINTLNNAFSKMTANLRRSEQTRNAFLADVTHELRTPLTVIKGTIETLEDGALDDLEGRDALLSGMHRESERLIRLVNDLLLLTRFDAGMLTLNPQPLELNELVQARCRQYAPLAARRDIKLEIYSSTNICRTLADADRLAQVLDNLLDNAIRHSPDGSSILINLSRVGQEWCCGVNDRGPGIPPEHLPFIFERFYRVDTSRNRKSGGAGLGLAISRALILAQHGRIDAESLPGQGTHIRFYLPAI
ncbi:MAG: ATP-binding protein [Anaerolineae bacterium]|nr:ATP-binding protein [Anaerolineae bacterium]